MDLDINFRDAFIVLLCVILMILCIHIIGTPDVSENATYLENETSVEKQLCAKYCWQDDCHVSIYSDRYTFSYYCEVN
jgi:hypothetical protein